MITLLVYGVSILDQVRELLYYFSMFAGLALGTIIIAYLVSFCEDCFSKNKGLELRNSLPVKKTIATLAVVSVLSALLPSTKSGYIIAATAVAEQQQVIGKVLDVPKKVLDILNLELDKITKQEQTS